MTWTITRKCPDCDRLLDGDLTCVCKMSPGELMDEIATFEPDVEHHAAWKELTQRVVNTEEAIYNGEDR